MAEVEPRVIERSSGNVFADLGIPASATHNLKADLVIKIREIMKARGLTQVAAADILDIGQPDLSKILRGVFRGVSVERLLEMLTKLDLEVEIAVKHHGRHVGEVIHLEPAHLELV